MKVLSIINIKGGVAKTATAVNMACNLAAVHKQRVLLIDLDPQGHSSLFYGVRSYDANGIDGVMLGKHGIADCVVLPQSVTLQDNLLKIAPADMRLVTANRAMLIDTNRTPRTLRKALAVVSGDYDYVVIDHAPSLDLSTINGLCASDHVIVPVTPDDFAADGLDILRNQINTLRDDWDAPLRILGCVFTQWRSSNAATAAVRTMAETGLPMMDAVIRATCRVPETEKLHTPLLLHAPRSTAAQDYLALTSEYVRKVSKTDTNKVEV